MLTCWSMDSIDHSLSKNKEKILQNFVQLAFFNPLFSDF